MTTAVIRPVRSDDLDSVVALAERATFGLTTLPKDRELLAARIRDSELAFSRISETPRGERYLFVLEQPASGAIIGTSGIVSKVGGFEPFYAYAIETSVHESKFLGVRKEIHTLHLVRVHDGPCEIGSLFLSPDMRESGYGRLLSLSRFVFMAEHPALFDPLVIAELRGVIDEAGGSPFWEAVGRHFFDVDLATADYLSVVNKRFIAELMPEHPIYIPLLPREAQEVIGCVHPNTQPARELLISEGFEDAGQVDIFEAGPTLRCPLADIRSIRESQQATVVDTGCEEPASRPYIIASSKIDFRACVATIDRSQDGGVRISPDAARAVGVEVGDKLRFVPLRARTAAAAGR